MFFDISIKDLIDVILVASLLYYFYRLMKESGSLNIFSGILIFTLLWIFVSRVLEMKLLGSIFDKLMSVGVLALIIIFQEEIRRFFKNLGSHRHFRVISDFFSKSKEQNDGKGLLLPVVMACMNMSQQKVGSLIVVEKLESISEYARTGENIDSGINQRLIETIFFKNSPLHDGALLIQNNRLSSASCILPVSHDRNISKNLGLRHRAALGISQETDAIAIIVSEETGTISIAERGVLRIGLTAQQLEHILAKK